MRKMYISIKFKLLTLFVLCLMTSLQAVSANDAALSQDCLDCVNFTSAAGTPVDTFEDVHPVDKIGYTLVGNGPTMPGHYLNAYKGLTKKKDGKDFQNYITNPHGKILYNHFSNFMKKYFFVYGPVWCADPAPAPATTSMHKTIIDKGRDKISNMLGDYCREKHFTTFPLTKSPSVVKYVLCLDGGWSYIPPFKHATVNACSCKVNHNFCRYVDDDPPGPCKHEGTMPCPMDPAICMCGCDHTTPEEHIQTEDNIFDNLGGYIENEIINYANGFPNGNSNNCVQSLDRSVPLNTDIKKELVMRFADRTPPRIIGSSGGNFPDLGLTIPATTGDWHKVKGLKVEDNSGCVVSLCLVIGKIDGFPSSNWASCEDWITGEIQTSLSPNYVIMPNTCHGAMHYSVFAWDEYNNLNPGEPLIVEDEPERCYGLRNPPNGKDLGRDPRPGGAKPWPIKFVQNDPANINDNNIHGSMRRGQGIIHIKDNDLPNIVIRIKSSKDGSTIFFPPLIEAGALSIYDSKDYIGGTNTQAYASFISGASSKSFTSTLVANPNIKSGFRIVDVVPSAVMSSEEQGIIGSLKSYISSVSGTVMTAYAPEKHVPFVAKNFRLEDYDASDTDNNGVMIGKDTSTYGARNGYGKAITAILLEPVCEDVEYTISVWADDNVKYSTVDQSGTILKNIISIPSGIVNGSVEVNVPNQFPLLSKDTTMNKYSSVSKKLKVVFREPTKGSYNTKAELITNKYPYIRASVTDFSGLKREIMLFLRVSDAKPSIRVIEHKHGKN